MPLKLIIKNIPKNEFRPSPPTKPATTLALAASVCIFGAIILGLSLISLGYVYHESGFSPLAVSFMDPADNTDHIEQEETLDIDSQSRTSSHMQEHTITTYGKATWSKPMSFPIPNMSPLSNADIPPDYALLTIEIDLGKTTFAQPRKKRSTTQEPQINQPSLQLARYKNTPRPPYPKSAKMAGQEGVVTLLIQIDEEGLPSKVSIADSSGVPELDDISVKWVQKKWSFYPAVQGNNCVSCSIKAPLRFTIN